MAATAPGDRLREARQVRDANALSNRLRTARAEAKELMRVREMDPWSIVLTPPWWAQGMRLLDFLEHVPGLGYVRLRRLNLTAARAGVNLLTTMGDQPLASRQWIVRNALPTSIAIYPSSPTKEA